MRTRSREFLKSITKLIICIFQYDKNFFLFYGTIVQVIEVLINSSPSFPLPCSMRFKMFIRNSIIFSFDDYLFRMH